MYCILHASIPKHDSARVIHSSLLIVVCGGCISVSERFYTLIGVVVSPSVEMIDSRRR